jgi:hypothetical protein
VKIIKPAFKYECNPIDFKFIKQEETRYYAVKDVVDFGVKKTLPDNLFDTSVVEYNIENGINEVIPLPAQDGNRDWGNYYHRQKDRTKPHTQYVDDVIENSIGHIDLGEDSYSEDENGNPIHIINKALTSILYKQT